MQTNETFTIHFIEDRVTDQNFGKAVFGSEVNAI